MSILNGSLVVESQQESFINKVESYQEPSNAEKLADMVLKINLANVMEDGTIRRLLLWEIRQTLCVSWKCYVMPICRLLVWGCQL